MVPGNESGLELSSSTDEQDFIALEVNKLRLILISITILQELELFTDTKLYRLYRPMSKTIKKGLEVYLLNANVKNENYIITFNFSSSRSSQNLTIFSIKVS